MSTREQSLIDDPIPDEDVDDLHQRAVAHLLGGVEIDPQLVALIAATTRGGLNRE